MERTDLVTKLVLHMPLNTTQHEGLQDHVEATKLVFVELAALVLGRILDVLREPLVELVVRVEQARHDKVEQSPQFCTEIRYDGTRCSAGAAHPASSFGWEYRLGGDGSCNGSRAKSSSEHWRSS